MGVSRHDNTNGRARKWGQWREREILEGGCGEWKSGLEVCCPLVARKILIGRTEGGEGKKEGETGWATDATDGGELGGKKVNLAIAAVVCVVRRRPLLILPAISVCDQAYALRTTIVPVMRRGVTETGLDFHPVQFWSAGIELC